MTGNKGDFSLQLSTRAHNTFGSTSQARAGCFDAFLDVDVTVDADRASGGDESAEATRERVPFKRDVGSQRMSDRRAAKASLRIADLAKGQGDLAPLDQQSLVNGSNGLALNNSMTRSEMAGTSSGVTSLGEAAARSPIAHRASACGS
jgi:hypothetical protein